MNFIINALGKHWVALFVIFADLYCLFWLLSPLATPAPLGGDSRSWGRPRIIITFLMSGLIYTALVRITFLFLVGIVNWEDSELVIEEEKLDVISKWGHSLTYTRLVGIYWYDAENLHAASSGNKTNAL